MSDSKDVNVMLSDTVKVLLLDVSGIYWVAPANSFSSFGVVSVPYRATFIAEGTVEIPADVLAIFKDAKFIHIKLHWEIL
jgi:hypothetical protein